MVRTVLVLGLVLAACGGPPPSAPAPASREAASPKASSSAAGAPWWRPSRWSRPADFETWTWGDVRPGPGLLGPDGIVLWRRAAPGSTDPEKPRKTRR